MGGQELRRKVFYEHILLPKEVLPRILREAEAACPRVARLLEELAQHVVLPIGSRGWIRFVPPRALIAPSGGYAAVVLKVGGDYMRALFPTHGLKTGMALYSTMAGYRSVTLVFPASGRLEAPILWMSGAPAELSKSNVYRKALAFGGTVVVDRIAWSPKWEALPPGEALEVLSIALRALFDVAGGGGAAVFALPVGDAERFERAAERLGLQPRRLRGSGRRFRYYLVVAPPSR